MVSSSLSASLCVCIVSHTIYHLFHVTRHSDPATLRVGTAMVLEYLQQQHPMTDFSFALGSDTFLDLTNWKWQRSRDVINLLEGRLFVLYRRQSIDGDADKSSSLEQLQDRVNSVNQEFTFTTEGIRILKIPSLTHVSSSMVRASSDLNELVNFLTPTVLEYIQTNKLYAFATKESGD